MKHGDILETICRENIFKLLNCLSRDRQVTDNILEKVNVMQYR